MQKKFYQAFLFPALMFLSVNDTLAQKPARPVASPVSQLKKPLVKSSLGKVNGDITLVAEEAAQLIGLPLVIADDKNVHYVISSYRFAYKRIGVTEDEETGKTSAQTDLASDRFTSTPLPAVWQKNIVAGLHKGEELYFFDIIVFDKAGRRFFAPELKINIR